MNVYTSRPIELKKDIQTIYGLVSKPTNLQPVLDKAGDKVAEYKIEISDEELTFFVPALGQVGLKKTETVAPNLVKYESFKSPVPLALQLNLSEESADKTLAQISVEVSIPPFLAGMVKGKITGALDKVANLLEKVDFSRIGL